MSFSSLVGFGLAFAIFILGILSLKSSLSAFSERLAPLLCRAFGHPLLGVMIGFIVTALVQSSSATNAMTVGFVAAGLLNLPQAFAVVLGSNLGTTLTAHAVAYSELNAGLALLTLSLMLQLVRAEDVKRVGAALGSVGAMFVGLWAIGQAVGDLAATPVGSRMFALFAEDQLGTLLYAAAITAIAQSSSAVSALMVELANTGVIGVDTAIVGVLGSNVGTVVTTMIAGAFAGALARRVALADLLFNVGSVALLWPFLGLFIAWVAQLSDHPGQQVAAAHTLFNLLGVGVMLPFIRSFSRLITRIAPM